MWTFAAVFVLLTAGHRAEAYVSHLRGILHYVSPDKHVVSHIKSSYSPDEKDRQWEIESREFGVSSNCSWSGIQNSHDGELDFSCATDSVLTGLHSFFREGSEDRRWSFRCCSFKNLITFECRESSMVNYWREDFDWQLPGGNLLTGVKSQHRNEDG
ncbi:dermatopontin-like, partial [Plectropomus leopardus]|uniref:dermatopontin-like n=1 Tax=Plectropomus leopardus TaxID=160734 RepID=UPI001C4C20E4